MGVKLAKDESTPERKKVWEDVRAAASKAPRWALDFVQAMERDEANGGMRGDQATDKANQDKGKA